MFLPPFRSTPEVVYDRAFWYRGRSSLIEASLLIDPSPEVVEVVNQAPNQTKVGPRFKHVPHEVCRGKQQTFSRGGQVSGLGTLGDKAGRRDLISDKNDGPPTRQARNCGASLKEARGHARITLCEKSAGGETSRAKSGPMGVPQCGTSPKTTDTPTDSDRLHRPAHAPLPKRSKTNQNDGFPCVVRPRQRCDGRLVSHEVFHYRKSIVGQGGGPSVPKIASVD